MKNFTIRELTEIKASLNRYRKVAQVANKYNVSRTTIYNYFYYDDDQELWEIRNEYARKINWLHSEVISLCGLINYDRIHCDKEIVKRLEKMEKKIQELRDLSVRI